jgi:hypothetical protein
MSYSTMESSGQMSSLHGAELKAVTRHWRSKKLKTSYLVNCST